jgi:hypothetical protein
VCFLIFIPSCFRRSRLAQARLGKVQMKSKAWLCIHMFVKKWCFINTTNSWK